MTFYLGDVYSLNLFALHSLVSTVYIIFVAWLFGTICSSALYAPEFTLRINKVNAALNCMWWVIILTRVKSRDAAVARAPQLEPGLLASGIATGSEREGREMGGLMWGEGK